MGSPGNETSTRPKAETPPTTPAADVGPAPPAERTGGLCATCSRRGDCPKRGTEGGIWRCSDYEE